LMSHKTFGAFPCYPTIGARRPRLRSTVKNYRKSLLILFS
jgi:hypothetical protein